MTDVVIETKNLMKTYRVGFLMNRLVRAVNGLSLQVGRGRVFGLVGPNGAGKSTTIKMLLNLVKPTSGEISILGQPPSHAQTRAQLGFVPENPAPYPHLTAEEFVVMSGRLAGLSGKELDDNVKDVLGRVEMTNARNLQIRRMSKGMTQRVALAQALVAKPKLLVLDEPTSGLDPLGRRQFRDLLLAQRDAGVTIVFCTHIIPDVESLCDDIALVVGGQLHKAGDVRAIMADDTNQTEIELSGCTPEVVATWGVPLGSTKRLQSGVLLRVAEADTAALLRRALDAGAAVVRVQHVRRGLEELFVETVNRSGRLVGSEVS